MTQVTRRQHYVWRYYLEGWLRDNGQVYCFRNGNLFSTNPKNIMVERDFYRVSNLTRNDKAFFESWLEQLDPHLQEVNRGIYRLFLRVSNANNLLQNLPGVSHKHKLKARAALIDAEEKLHADTENGAVPMLQQLRRGRTDFLKDYETTILFFHFIAHQFFRTKSVRDAASGAFRSSDKNYDYGRLRNLFCYCVANNLSKSLFVNRGRFYVSFLRNTNDGICHGRSADR